ncbi:alanine racemase [Burkholderiaceae bacterium DAT-1]|nr:alanine racemase [Burkholderiaceae bacterium DAT-1]
MISRRSVLIGSGALAVAAVAAKPGDQGGPYPPYFADLNQTLRRHGIDRPVLLIDLDRLDRNIDRVRQSIAKGSPKQYRIVVKSIPSPALVDYVAKRSQSTRLMCFHRPFVQAMAQLRPDADILLGKPMPVAALHTFYSTHQGPFDPAKQLQWLVDTEARLHEYLALAQTMRVRLRVNLEIDVGLHRGGLSDPSQLGSMLKLISDHPDHLQFAGFMGYDAHLMGLPGFLARREQPRVHARYEAFVAALKRDFPKLVTPDLTFNGAGSPTFRDYEGETVLNDISAGTCLLKPSHYDIDNLSDFEPATYIASPVLKRLQGGNLPALEELGPLIRGWDVNQAQMYFAYSGNWLADPIAPPGVHPHFAYTSSNQQGYTASARVQMDVNDFLFLRPTQSEAVLLQFGDLVAVRGKEIVDRWPVLPVGI